MAAKNSQHLVEFRKALDKWIDERFISRQEIDTLATFHMYLVNLAEEDGWTYDGHSLKIALPMSLLVVRGTMDGVPHIVFSSGRTAMDCVAAFLRKLDQGWLEWRPDQFRQ